MFKKLLSSLMVALTLFGCSKSENLETEVLPKEEDKYKTGVDLSNSSSIQSENFWTEDPYLMLGYGYDATGKYAHPTAIRKKVFDVVKLEEEREGRVSFFRSSSSGSELHMSGTIEDCIRQMSRTTGIDVDKVINHKNLFRGVFETPFTNDTTFKDADYRFLGFSDVMTTGRSFFNYPVASSQNELEQFLSEEFIQDVNSKSADQIIAHYGTHVLQWIVIGRRIDYLYRYADDMERAAVDWIYYNKSRFFQAWTTVWASEPSRRAPLKENLFVQVVDNLDHSPNCWMIDITNYKGQPVKFSGWDALDESDVTLVDFGNDNGSLIPIYDFIADESKKAQVIEAFEKYLGNTSGK